MAIETTSKEGDKPMNLALNQHRTRDECGSTLLETALSMMIMLTFIFGVMEASFAYYTFHFISQAAREGTRYAIVRGNTAGSSNCTSPGWPTCKAQSADIQTYVQNLGFPGIDPSKMTVTTAWSGYPAGVTCKPSLTCNNPGNLVTVTVQYNFPFRVPFIPVRTYSMMSSSAMVISQ